MRNTYHSIKTIKWNQIPVDSYHVKGRKAYSKMNRYAYRYNGRKAYSITLNNFLEKNIEKIVSKLSLSLSLCVVFSYIFIKNIKKSFLDRKIFFEELKTTGHNNQYTVLLYTNWSSTKFLYSRNIV